MQCSIGGQYQTDPAQQGHKDIFETSRSGRVTFHDGGGTFVQHFLNACGLLALGPLGLVRKTRQLVDRLMYATGMK